MSRGLMLMALALAAPPLVLLACAGDDGEAPPKIDTGLEVAPASTIPEVCSTIGRTSACDSLREHLERRSMAAQEDCKKGIEERRCGEARFLLESCLDQYPLCYDDAGVPTNDDAARCAFERDRWVACEAAAPP